MLRLPVDVPVDLDADTARELARRELADPAFQADRPGLVERAATWVVERVLDVLDAADGASPGGIGGLVALVVVGVLVVLLVRRRLGRAAATARAASPLFDAGPRPAAELRRDAAAADAEGRHDDAVRAWMRALVRGLEERDLLPPRAGRTAGEAVREAARAVPAAADAVAAAGRVFDRTAYGGRRADADAASTVRTADEQVRGARPAPLSPAGSAR